MMGGKELKEIKIIGMRFFLGNDSTPLHSTPLHSTQLEEERRKKTERR